MFKFENLHRNKKLAFLDGFLCGVFVAYYGYKIHKEIEENTKLEELLEELKDIETPNV